MISSRLEHIMILQSDHIMAYGNVEKRREIRSLLNALYKDLTREDKQILCYMKSIIEDLSKIKLAHTQ